MITHHYVTGNRGLEDQDDVEALLKARARQLADSGIGVLRIKLEHEPLSEHSDPLDIPESLNSIYTEIHIKCVVSPEQRDELTRVAARMCWHPSRNPFATREDGLLVQFVNRRFYGEITMTRVDEFVDTLIPFLLPVAAVEEIKYESAVYDSNEEHDQWWMQ
jgi:hypothetical protein